jgi:flagellar protein FlaI
MHTGHSVYSTIHADTVEQTYRRLINPPINVPPTMLESLHLFLVQFRQRRLNLRRTFEVAELRMAEEGIKANNPLNKIYKWVARDDKIVSANPLERVAYELEIRAGMSPKDIKKDLKDKQEVLKWMFKNKIRDITDFGKVISNYYMEEASVLDLVKKDGNPKKLLGK